VKEKATSRQNNKKIGNFGELYAKMFLMKQGFLISEENFRVFFGEIDLIAQKNDTIHFIEVKTVSRETYKRGIKPENHVTREKIFKIQRVAEFYISNKSLFHKNVQIDVVAIVADKDEILLQSESSVPQSKQDSETHIKPIIWFFENVTL